jgi:hypothetical protein
MPLGKIGKFEQIGSVMAVCDPFVNIRADSVVKNRGILLHGVRAGVYYAFVRKEKGIVYEAFVIHESMCNRGVPRAGMTNISNYDEHGTIAVDSGSGGFMDAKFLTDRNFAETYLTDRISRKNLDDASSRMSTIKLERSLWVDYTLRKKINNAAVPHGALVSAGYGDGIYPCFVYHSSGKICAAALDFA